MTAPWERYQQQDASPAPQAPAGGSRPWERYAGPQQPAAQPSQPRLAPEALEASQQVAMQDPTREASLGERFMANADVGFEGTLAGQAVENWMNEGNRYGAQAGTVQDVLRYMADQGLDTAPDVLPNPAQGGAPSPEGADYLGAGVETTMPGRGTGDLAGMSLPELQERLTFLQEQQVEGQAEYDAQRAPVLARREGMPSWYEEEGLSGKGVAGIAALLGQLAGGAPSPENVVAFGRGASVLGRAGRGAAGGAAGAGIAEPVVQQQEVRRGEREDTSLGEGAFNVALGGLLGGTLNLTPDAVRGIRRLIAGRKGKPEADVNADDLQEFDPDELMRMAEQASQGRVMEPDEVSDAVGRSTRIDPRTGEPLAPEPLRGEQRAERERELGDAFSGTDVLRREDVQIGPEGIEVPEGTPPARDPTGEQANPETYGARSTAARTARELGVTLDENGIRLAARDIQADPQADPAAIVRSYSQEGRGSAFEAAERRRQRREEDLATGENVDRQASTYRAAEEPYERQGQREVVLLGARRDADGRLTGGEPVEVLGTVQQTRPDGQTEEMVRVQRGDNEPELVRASELELVQTPENPRMFGEALGQTQEPPRGVMTERGDSPEGFEASQTPQPRRAVDRQADPDGLRRGRFEEGTPEPGPQPAGPTPRAGENIDGNTGRPYRESDRTDVTPQGERRTEFQGEGGQIPVTRTRRPVNETRSYDARMREPDPSGELNLDTAGGMTDAEMETMFAGGGLPSRTNTSAPAPEPRAAQPAPRTEAPAPRERVNPNAPENLADPEVARVLRDSKAEYGWQERGGELIRDAEGRAAGRTKWLPQNEALMDALKNKKVTKDGYAKLVDRALDPDAKPLTNRQRGILEEVLDAIDPNARARAEAAEQADMDAQFGRPDEGPADEPDFDLAPQTEASRRAEEAQARTRAEEQRRAQENEAQRAQADRDADDFTLTGSNRPADEAAARGQRDLDDAPAAPRQSQQPEAEPAPRQAEPEPTSQPEPRQRRRQTEPKQTPRSDTPIADALKTAKTGADLLDAIEPFVPARFRPLLDALRQSRQATTVMVDTKKRLRGAEGAFSTRIQINRRTGESTIVDERVEVDLTHIRRMERGEGRSRLGDNTEESVAQIMLHEVLHAGTTKGIRRDVPLTGGKVGKGLSVDEAKWSTFDASEKLEAIRRKLRERSNDTALDDTTRANLRSAAVDTAETVAWGMSNPEVQAVLRTMPAFSKRHGNKFREFIDAVREALGLGDKHRSALTDLVEQTARLMDDVDAGEVRILRNRSGSQRNRTSSGDDVETTELRSRIEKDALDKGAIAGAKNKAETKGYLADAMSNATGWRSRDAKRWVDETADLGRALRESREARREDQGNQRFYQKGSTTRRASQMLFGSADGELRVLADRYDSDTLRKLADVFHATSGRGEGVSRTYSERVSEHLNTGARQVQDLTDFLSDNRLKGGDAQRDIVRMVENPRIPRKGPKGEAANRIEKWFADELEYQREAGVEIGEVDNYFARSVDPGKISGMRGKAKEDRFVTQATKAYREVGYTTEQASEAARQLLNKILHGDTTMKPGSPKIAGGVPTQNVKPRRFTQAAAKHLEEFYDRDVGRVMSRYLMSSTKRAEIARSSIPDADGNPIVFGDRWNNWENVTARLNEEGVPESALTDVTTMVSVMAGVENNGTNASLMKASTFIRTIGALSFLDRVALSSVPELFTGALRGMEGNPVRDLGTLVRNTMWDVSALTRKSLGSITGRDMQGRKMAEANALAEDLGIIAGDSISYLMNARFIGDDASSTLMQRVQTGFFKNVLLTQLNDYTRVKSMRHGHTFTRRQALDALTDNPRQQRRGNLFLRELGVPEGQERAFAQWFERNGYDKDMPEAGDLMGRKGEDGKFAEMYRTGLHRFVDQSVMRPDQTTRPRWTSHPAGAMAFHLLNFTWAFQKNVINRWGRLAASDDLDKLDKLMMLPGFAATSSAMYGAAFLAGEVRDELSEMSSTREQTPRTDGFLAERALSYTGFTGKVDPLLQMFGGLRYQRGILESFAGPSVGNLVGPLEAALNTQFENSENTNTAERNLTKAVHQTMLTPAMQAGLALAPGFGLPGLAVKGMAISGVRATREPTMDAVAGPEAPDATRRRTSQPMEGLVERYVLDDESGGSSRSSGGRAGSGRSTGRSGGREAGR